MTEAKVGRFSSRHPPPGDHGRLGDGECHPRVGEYSRSSASQTFAKWPPCSKDAGFYTHGCSLFCWRSHRSLCALLRRIVRPPKKYRLPYGHRRSLHWCAIWIIFACLCRMMRG